MDQVTPQGIQDLTQAMGTAPQTSGPSFSIDPKFADDLFQQGKINQDTYSMIKSRMPAAAPTPEKLPPVQVQETAPLAEPTAQIDPLTQAMVRNQIDIGQSTATQRAGIGMQAQAAAMQAKNVSDIYLDTAKKIEDEENRRKIVEAERQDQLNNALKTYENSIKEAAGGQIDPNRFYGSLNTGQKIGLGIAAILAGFAGGDNKVVKMIENSVNKDIDLQKQEYERKLASGKQAQNVFSLMKDKFQDDKSADLAARSAILERMKLQLEGEAAKYQGAEAQGKFKMALGMLDSQLATARQEFLKRQEEKAALGQLYGMGGEKSPESRRIDQLIMSLPDEKTRTDAIEKRVTGKGYDFIGRSKERAKAVNDLGIEANTALEMIDDLKKMGGRSLPLTESRQRSQSIQKALAGMLRVPITGPGAMTKDEYDRLLELIPNPTELTTVNGAERLNQLQTTLRTKLKTAVESEGGKYYGQVDFTTERAK